MRSVIDFVVFVVVFKGSNTQEQDTFQRGNKKAPKRTHRSSSSYPTHISSLRINTSIKREGRSNIPEIMTKSRNSS